MSLEEIYSSIDILFNLIVLDPIGPSIEAKEAAEAARIQTHSEIIEFRNKCSLRDINN